MKKIKHSLFAILVTLSFVGCSTKVDREGYAVWDYEFIVKDGEGGIYIPIGDYKPALSEQLPAVPLYKLQSNRLIKSTYLLKDLTRVKILDEEKLINGGFYYIAGINVDDEIDNIVMKIQKENEIENNDRESFIIENDLEKKIKLTEYISTYYQGMIDFKKILLEMKSRLPEDYVAYKGNYLRISLYPEGLYIVYPSKEKVDYKSTSTREGGFDPQAEPRGYYVSYYRYYPISNPEDFIDVKLPFLKDIENM